jgi:hypothetical protein
MNNDLLQPAATIVAAVIASEAQRVTGSPQASTTDLFVSTYRSLEKALEQIQQEDKASRKSMNIDTKALVGKMSR